MIRHKVQRWVARITLAILISTTAVGTLSAVNLRAAARTLPASAAQAAQPTNTITVSGFGEAVGAPNVATLQLGVEKFDADASKALAAASAAITKVTDALKAAGVSANDIQTQTFNLYSVTPPTEPGKAPNPADRLYQAQIMLTVKVRDIEKTGTIIDKGIEAGATNIFGLNFTIDDTTKMESEARSKALQDARRRAEELAKALGVTLGDPIIVIEGLNNGVVAVMDGAMVGRGGGGNKIETGQLSVGVSLQVTYAISK